MVMNIDTDYRYKIVNEYELDKLLSGHEVSGSILLPSSSGLSHLALPNAGATGVLWKSGSQLDTLACPLVVIAHDEDVRRLCGRYAQLRSDLSPLTAWCHLLAPAYFDSVESLVRVPDLGAMEAAWVGLIVAETLMLVEKPIANVRISGCLATQSFAIARASALWRDIPAEEILRQFDAANRLCRNENTAQRKGGTEKLRSSLRPIWEILVGCLLPGMPHRSDLQPFVSALIALQQARASKDDHEAYQFAKPLMELVPAAEEFRRLPELAPEQRLRLFDKLVEGLDETQTPRRVATTLLAGYLATVAAGGAPSLSLAENHTSRWPDILAWAYLIGGVGEKVVWTSAFDGLGRLVARELLRPFRLDESPTCDFAFEEASVLADTQLADPLVHLKIKQARLVNVALFPGVNVSIPIVDSPTQGIGRSEPSKIVRAPEPPVRDPMVTLAETLWPHLRSRMDEHFRSLRKDIGEATQEHQAPPKTRGKRKSSSQPQLPLVGDSKKT